MKFYGRGTLHMLLMHYNDWSLSNSTMYPRSLGTPKVPWDPRNDVMLKNKVNWIMEF